MPHFISIQNLQDAGLDIYARLSEVQLLRYREPKPGIFIAESPIVVERALAAGYRPISVLMDEAGVPKQQGLLKVCGEIPVYTARFDVLTQITGFKLTRGMLCAMERNELPQADILCRDMYRIAVLEDVMNPTNVGAIFRYTGEQFGSVWAPYSRFRGRICRSQKKIPRRRFIRWDFRV